MNEGLILYTYYEGVDDIGVGDFLKLILALYEALYVIAKAFNCLTLASHEVARGAGLSVSPFKVVAELVFEVAHRFMVSSRRLFS
jgi:hypothetical protein